jgi:hypothetical protein
MPSFFLALFLSLGALAHQSSLSGTGNDLYWANPRVPMVIQAANGDMTEATARSIILSSISEWNRASSGQITVAGASTNEIRFRSSFSYGSAVIGVTEVSFNASGAIQRATVSLNDEDYYFRSAPGLYPAGQVYLGDVVTHELGHVLGLSHSEVLDASMFYSSFTGQASLSLDDVSGIRSKYDAGEYGSITGVVRGGRDVPVLGAHVQAVSLANGETSGAVTDDEGRFALRGLDLGDAYYLYVSPVKNPASLPGFFANAQTNFCPAAYVGSFFSRCGTEYDGKPQAIVLSSAQPAVDVGTVSISCSLRADAGYNERKIAATFSPLSIFTYADAERTEHAFVGWFRNPSASTWSASDVFQVNYAPLTGSNYFLKVAVVSFALGTQLEYQLDVKTTLGTVVNARNSLRYDAVTESYHPDFEALIPFDPTVPARNNFEIAVRARRLGSSTLAQTFPDATTFSSGTYLPYLLVTSLWDNSSGSLKPVIGTEQVLSDNDACLDGPFTYAVARTRDVASSSASSTSDPVAAAAGCGTIEPPRGGGPGSSLPLLALGFLLATTAATLLKSRKNFLS